MVGCPKYIDLVGREAMGGIIPGDYRKNDVTWEVNVNHSTG
jgi:hypothetical protein